jgi:O-antigen/teichoic acid export membrane protein
VSAVYAGQAIAAVRSFINARWLGPADYGFWGWLTFIVSFGYHLHLGMQEMMLKEVSELIARGRLDHARRLVQINFTYYLAVLSVAAFGIAAVAPVVPLSMPLAYRWGWVVAGVVMLFEVMFYFEQVVARVMGKFDAIAKAVVVTNAVSLALTAWLVIAHRLIGMYAVAIATPLFGFFFLHRRTQYPLKFVWSEEKIIDGVSRGWPVVALGMGFLATNWVDRVIIMRLLGVTSHGYYTFGATVAFMVFLFPKGVADVLEPKLHFGASQKTANHSIQKHFLVPSRIMAWIMPVCLCAGHFILPWIVRVALPEYLPGVGVMRVLMWSSYFVGLLALEKSSLVALGKQFRALPVLAGMIVMNACVSLWMVRHGFGVAGVAAGSGIALGAGSLSLMLLVARELKEPAQVTVRHLAQIYVPFACVCIGSFYVF